MRSFLGILVICSMAACSHSSQEKEQSAELVTDAKQLIDGWSGNSPIPLVRITTLLDQAILANPKNADAYAQYSRVTIKNGYLNGSRANAVFRDGTLESAVQHLDRALEVDPSHGKALVLYGHVATLQRRLDVAREKLTKADELKVTDPYLQINWADLLLVSGDSGAAAERYHRLIDSKPDNTRALRAAYVGLRVYYWNKGDADKVDEMFLAYLELAPGEAWAKGNYAQFLLFMKPDQIDKALRYAEEAIEIKRYGLGLRIYLTALCKKRDVVEDQTLKSEYNGKALSIDPDGCESASVLL